MLTYTFSRREKFLMVLLAVLLLALLWYQLVIVSVQGQVAQLDSQIADVQATLAVDQAKVTKLGTMRKAVDAYEAEGLVATTMPSYDNQQNVMSQLNAVLAGSSGCKLSFDALDTGTTGLVKRGVSLSFGCDSYDDARATLMALFQGPYPCSVDSMSISDNSSTKSSYATAATGTSSTSAYSATAHLTFYERCA